jgi:hypothetical protein
VHTIFDTGPSFKFLDNEFRLDKTDAKFVDIHHTNGGTRLLFGGHYGLFDALGHVDVYFNGGTMQTGCPRQRTALFESESQFTTLALALLEICVEVI